MSKGWGLDLSNVAEDMANVRTKLKAGKDIKNVHSESKRRNIYGDEGSIRRPSSDGSKEMSLKEMSLEQIIDRAAHFESGSDESTEMPVRERFLEQMLAEYCDDSSRGVDEAIKVDGWLSTEDADRATNVDSCTSRRSEKIDKRKQ